MDINSLLNGVSQQTPALRLPSQADAQDNAMSSLVDGLHKRNPTEHIAKLLSGTPVKPLVHTVHRDNQEQYQMLFTAGDLKVFDLKGNEKTVLFPNGKDYLKALDPRGTLKALTVEDYTFVVNRDIRPAMSVTPYLTTDRVTCTLNFGDGTLGDPKVYPKPVTGYFQYAYKSFTSTANPEGWQVSGAYATYGEALFAATASGSVTGWEASPEILSEGSDPAYDNVFAPGSAGIQLKGIRITEKETMLFQISGFNSGQPFDPDLRIYYKNSLTGDTLEDLRPEVGWPDGPYKVPGFSYQERVMPVFDGSLFVQVNGMLFSKDHTPGWSATDYLDYFVAQISGSFPELTVSTNAGWQMVIEAPAGGQVYVSAWDSNHRGYVKAIYSDLPIQEAVFAVITNGVAEQTYSLSLNGNLYSYTAGDTNSPNTYKIDTIANNLAASINAGGVFQAATYGNFIKVIHPGKVPIKFAAHDTWNDQAMYAMKNRVQAFEDLPAKFVPGHPVEVVGTDGLGGFYVHYTLKGAQPPKAYGLERQVTVERPFTLINPAGNTWNALEGDETGLWEECAKPGVPDVLIPHTMPHVLISNADGTFTFKPVDWFKRECGDADSVPAPSFVGKAIADVFFHRNRLGFLTGESVLFSRSGQFFNFWAQTARDVLDSDPIDHLVSHTKVATLRHTAVFNNQLLIFADTTQFVVSAAQILSPKTIAVQPSTEYACSPVCKPVTVGPVVHFVADSTSEGQQSPWSTVWEYFVETNAVSNTADNITAHVPRYIPKGVFKLSPSVSLDMLVALSDETPGALYVHKFAWTNEGKAQLSWSRWTFKGSILNADFVGGTLVLTMQHADGVYLEKLDLSVDRTEEDFPFLVYLDRKVRLQGSFDEESNTTSFTLPYPLGSHDITLVNASRGSFVPHEASDGVLVVQGNLQEAIAGYTYPFLYRFSPVFARDQRGATRIDVKVMLRQWLVSYEKTLEFELVVTPEKRPEQVTKFNPRVTGVSALLSSIEPADGVLKAAAMGEGKKTRVEIRSESHYPCFFQSARWEGDKYPLR